MRLLLGQIKRENLNQMLNWIKKEKKERKNERKKGRKVFLTVQGERMCSSPYNFY